MSTDHNREAKQAFPVPKQSTRRFKGTWSSNILALAVVALHCTVAKSADIRDIACRTTEECRVNKERAL
jgi:hypothetical protein